MLGRLLGGVADLLVALIFIDFVASWIPPLDRHAVLREIRRITAPVLWPFRAILPPERIGIDISPMLAILALHFVAGLF